MKHLGNYGEVNHEMVVGKYYMCLIKTTIFMFQHSLDDSMLYFFDSGIMYNLTGLYIIDDEYECLQDDEIFELTDDEVLNNVVSEII